MRSIKKTKIVQLLIGITLLVSVIGVGGALSSPAAAAAPIGAFADTTLCPNGSSTNPNAPGICGQCANSQSSACVTCSNSGTTTCGDPAAVTCGSTPKQCDLITSYLNPILEILSICVGIVVVISLISGGIQYSTSAGDPQKVSAAKGRITKTIVALIAYIFLYAFLQFLIPGGIG